MPSLPALLALDEEGFRREFRGTALRRAKRRGLLRNAAIVLGNRLAAHGPAGRTPQGSERADGLAALRKALDDPEPLVRGAAAWALGQAEDGEARRALERAAETERDETVREEVRLALQGCGPGREKAAP